MPVTLHTRADNGQEMAQITPTPRAHVGLVHQPTYSTVLEVSSGQVLELTNGPSLYCGGYASGFNRLKTMNTAPIVAVNMPKAHNVTAARMYAEWFDGQRADVTGEFRPETRAAASSTTETGAKPMPKTAEAISLKANITAIRNNGNTGLATRINNLYSVLEQLAAAARDGHTHEVTACAHHIANVANAVADEQNAPALADRAAFMTEVLAPERDLRAAADRIAVQLPDGTRALSVSKFLAEYNAQQPEPPAEEQSYDSGAAMPEGWILADDSERGLEIQKYDEDERQRFESDEDAARHVQTMADQGDVNALAALRAIANKPLQVQIDAMEATIPHDELPPAYDALVAQRNQQDNATTRAQAEQQSQSARKRQVTANCAACKQPLYLNGEGNWAHQHGGNEYCASGQKARAKDGTIRNA